MPDFHVTFRDLLHAVNLRHEVKQPRPLTVNVTQIMHFMKYLPQNIHKGMYGGVSIKGLRVENLVTFGNRQLLSANFKVKERVVL
jgi:hypothetical protein